MCFAWISEQTAIISLYSIDLSVFKTEAESVYCAVRNESFKSDRHSFKVYYASALRASTSEQTELVEEHSVSANRKDLG